MWSTITVLAALSIAVKYSKALQNPECGFNSFRHRQPRTLTFQNPQARIIGGRDTQAGEWPWQVSIQLTHPYWGHVGHWCGGVLVNPQWVITAAHCIVNRLFHFRLPPLWIVVAGEHNLKSLDYGEQSRKVRRVLVHSLFREYHHDVALIQLTEPMSLSAKIQPICLPIMNATRNLDLKGLKCIATGWGQQIQGQKNAETLQRVEMPIVSNELCGRAYNSRYKLPIELYHLCAGAKMDSKGTCVGDSGGPLQCSITDGRWYLVGVTSFGSGCAKPGFPDVFTRITTYVDWILNTIKQYS